MLFRIVIVCILLAASYAVFEFVSVWRSATAVYNPSSTFTVRNDGNQTNLTIVEFLNYDCHFCRMTHTTLMSYAESNPEVRIVVRPFPNVGGYSEEAAEMVLAAGLQGKFWEMDDAIIGYTKVPDERFYRETAGLLDIDYDKMRKDSEGPEVQDMIGENADTVIRLNIKSTPAVMIGKTLHQMDKPLTLSDLISMVAAERAR